MQNQAEDIRDRNKLSQIHSPEVRGGPSAGTLARKAAGCRHCLLDLVGTSRFPGVQEKEGRACLRFQEVFQLLLPFYYEQNLFLKFLLVNLKQKS